jgi:hypothetical protein
VTVAHNDYTERSALQRMRDVLAPETAERRLLAGRFAIVNVWRSFEASPERFPLAVADGARYSRPTMSPLTLSTRTAPARSTTPRTRAGSAGSTSRGCNRTKLCSSSVSTRRATDARDTRHIQGSLTRMRRRKRRRGRASRCGRCCTLPDSCSDAEETWR